MSEADPQQLHFFSEVPREHLKGDSRRCHNAAVPSVKSLSLYDMVNSTVDGGYRGGACVYNTSELTQSAFHYKSMRHLTDLHAGDDNSYSGVQGWCGYTMSIVLVTGLPRT